MFGFEARVPTSGDDPVIPDDGGMHAHQGGDALPAQSEPVHQHPFRVRSAPYTPVRNEAHPAATNPRYGGVEGSPVDAPATVPELPGCGRTQGGRRGWRRYCQVIGGCRRGGESERPSVCCCGADQCRAPAYRLDGAGGRLAATPAAVWAQEKNDLGLEISELFADLDKVTAEKDAAVTELTARFTTLDTHAAAIQEQLEQARAAEHQVSNTAAHAVARVAAAEARAETLQKAHDALLQSIVPETPDKNDQDRPNRPVPPGV
ncbi:putative membrane protein [Arthrobacter sp. MP_M7]|nr:putative membrane protein [Arthrobacter sp. MP_M4]MEC5203299.1 putative membrane protein [Arthrobacter sp. MP_M7]